MKKQEKNRRTQNNNPYNLEDYRNRKKSDSGTQGNDRHTTSRSNPYRNQYVTEEALPRRQPVNHSGSTYAPYEQSSYGDTRNQKTVNSVQPEEARAKIKKNNKLSRKQMLKLKRKRRMQMFQRMLIMVFLGMFLSYSTLKIIDFFTYPPISYQTVRQGIIDKTQFLEGMVVREETVVNTTRRGDLHYVVGEGEKVAKGGDVCFVTDDNQIEATLNQMNVLDDSIYRMQDKRSNLSYFQAEIHQLNLEVVDEMKGFYYSRYWENPHSIYTMRKELEKVIQNRTSIYMNDQTEFTAEVQKQRAELQKQLRSVHNAYVAQQAGIISYQIDYLEETVNPEFVQNMTYEQFKTLKKAHDKGNYDVEEEVDELEKDELEKDEIEGQDEQEQQLENQGAQESSNINSEDGALEQSQEEAVAEEEVAPSTMVSTPNKGTYPVYKIITDYDWQIVTYMNTEEVAAYEEGSRYPLYFENHQSQEPIWFKLAHKIEQGNKTKLIFTTNQKISDFLDTRYVKFSIDKNKAAGLKIPSKAIVEKNVMPILGDYIVEENHQSGVYRVNGESSVFVPVNIQYKNTVEGVEYVYVLQEIGNTATIQLGERIKHPETQEIDTVNKVDTVQGVYSINGSYAKFKRIKIVMTNKEYAILSKDQETTLKEFDQIISNPQHIKEEQLLRYMNVKN